MNRNLWSGLTAAIVTGVVMAFAAPSIGLPMPAAAGATAIAAGLAWSDFAWNWLLAAAVLVTLMYFAVGGPVFAWGLLVIISCVIAFLAVRIVLSITDSSPSHGPRRG